jgi:hypothetical protein
MVYVFMCSAGSVDGWRMVTTAYIGRDGERVAMVRERQTNSLDEAGMSFAINKSHFREPGMSFRINLASDERTRLRSRNVIENT